MYFLSKKLTLLFLLLITPFTFFAQPNIYMSGSITIKDQRIACYWKNENLITLPGGIGKAGADTYGITVDNGNVYVVGRYWNGTSLVPCYWINGIKYDLEAGPNKWPDGGGSANTICIENNTIYVGGSWNDGKKSIACYWKDGNRINLPTPSIENSLGSFVTSITINNGILYACGYYYDRLKYYACYWLDGKFYDFLIENAERTSAQKILFSGSELMIIGNVSTKGHRSGYININGKVEYIDGSHSLTDIFISNGKTYLLGYDLELTPTLWINKNRSIIEINNLPEEYYSTNALWILADEVFIVGRYNFRQGYSSTGCFWTNGQRFEREKECTNISGIYITE